MIDTPQIIKTEPQRTAAIHLTVARKDIQKVMGPNLRDLSAAIADQGIAVTGPWFTHHFRTPTDTFDFEICFPVAAEIKPSGDVKPSQLPAATVARTVYRGAYEGLGQAWGELYSWIAAQGRTPGPDLWECYLSGPESSPDPANWRTEFNCPLV